MSHRIAALTATTALFTLALCIAPAASTAAPTSAPTSAAPAPAAAPAPFSDLPRGHMVPAAGEDQLVVVYREAPGVPAERRSLHCHPAGGSHRQAPAACEQLDSLEEPFAPVPEGAMCTRIHGGPQTAGISGMWEGRRVWAEFNRSGGCEIARWEALVPVLPAVH